MRYSYCYFFVFLTVLVVGCRSNMNSNKIKTLQTDESKKPASSRTQQKLATQYVEDIFIIQKKQGLNLVHQIKTLNKIQKMIQKYQPSEQSKQRLSTKNKFLSKKQDTKTIKLKKRPDLDNLTPSQTHVVEEIEQVHFGPGRSSALVVSQKDSNLTTQTSLDLPTGPTKYEPLETKEDSLIVGRLSRDYSVDVKMNVPELLRNKIFATKNFMEGWQKHNLHTKTLLEHELYQPALRVLAKNREFYLSKVIKDGISHRDYAILYAKDQSSGQVFPRILYNSNSNGGWRFTPYLEYIDEETGLLNKGFGIHYTQETKLSVELNLALQELENSNQILNQAEFSMDSTEYFFDFIMNKHGTNTFRNETKVTTPKLLSKAAAYPPGELDTLERATVSEPLSAEIARLNFKGKEFAKFVPNLASKPMQTYYTKHPFLREKVRVEVFEAELEKRKVLWHMAASTEGIVWIDSIHYKDASLNSYGGFSEIINSGILTSKPFEYRFQVESLNSKEAIPINDSYADITALLDHLQPIKDYRKAKKIHRSQST